MHFCANYINGAMVPAESGETFADINPHDGREICRVARSREPDARKAIESARGAQAEWAALTAVARGDYMRAIAMRMAERREEIAAIAAEESGKSPAHALGETQAAIEMGLFIAGEGRRNYGKTMPASMAHRQVMTVRQPLGVAALITASNTPVANVAWKAFPAMFCGNASILKPSEDTPGTAWIFAEICNEVGIPPGVFNVLQGFGAESGLPLVESPDVDLVSFTGGHVTGSMLNRVAGERLAKTCMELGGKNALTVCDDADQGKALHWALASAFSNAGQRCAAASRIIVFEGIYAPFRERLVNAAGMLPMGVTDNDYLGPVINERQLNNMLAAVRRARETGANILTGGERSTRPEHAKGFYMQPTVIEDVAADAPVSRDELFGPITCLYKAKDLDEAIALANRSRFGLTSAVHTASLHRAMEYAARIRTGVVVVNGGTHGSEPHMGFGGLKDSGTGWREAGLESLDVYAEWKYINLIHNPEQA